MGYFEYVMVLVSIIIGLALTHVLRALGVAVHRLRGHGPPIRFDTVYLMWVAYVLIWLVSFWWWEFKFQDLDVEWTFGLYLFVIVYAIALFLLAVILVPPSMQGVTDSYEYFMAGRRWFFGMLLAVNAIDVADTFLKGFDWGVRPVFIVQIALLTAACIVGMLSRNRGVQLGAAIAAFGWQLLYSFVELGVLGSW